MKVENIFWESTKTSVSINPYKLKEFLQSEGFGLFLMDKDRTSKKILFMNDNGTLKLYNPVETKRFVREILESITDDDFAPLFIEEEVSRDELLKGWSKYHPSRLNAEVLDDLEIYSEHDLDWTNDLQLFTDDQHSSYVRFRNGVVKITKDNIELLDPSHESVQGNVWESSIIERDINIKKSDGLFTKFVEKAVLVRDRNITNNDWIKEYPVTDGTKESLEALRTSFGYLIHSHNTPDRMKAIFFIDKGSDIGKPEGSNGKSLILQSLKHFKKMSNQDGRRFRNDVDGGGRFQFADVTLDTKLVLIDDLRTDFKLDGLFSMITGEMEIEGKGVNKFTIPVERKPKFCITSNYVLMQTATSHRRRMHIVEFGDYWNRCENKKESPSDEKHLGRMLFENYDQDDWDEFYNFGFECVQDYLKKGLVQADTSNYFLKALKQKIEGVSGDGTITGWMNDWIVNRREEISEDDLYNLFSDELTVESYSWDKKMFHKGFFTFVMEHPEYDYNGQLSYKGDNKSDRRFLVGKKGEQKPHIIVSVKDDDGTSNSPSPSVEPEIDYFSRLDTSKVA